MMKSMKKSDATRKTVKLVAGGLTLAAAAVVTLARRSGLSIRGKLLTSLVLPILRPNKKYASEDALERAIAEDRARGPAPPPEHLNRRFVIIEELRHGMRVFAITPRKNPSKTKILYLHGGGYVFDLVKPHWTLISGLAERSGATILVPLYPLAPEHTWIDAFEAVTALHDELTQDHEAKHLVLSGDSAGGGFALALAQQLLAHGHEMPAGLVLFSPWW